MKQSVINKAIDEWRSRLAACVHAKGQHFEHLLCWTWALLHRLCNCVPKEFFINVAVAKTTLCVSQIAISCLQGSVETLFSWSEKFLYLLLTNLFRITYATKFYKNWLSFVEDITKTILVRFYGTQLLFLF